MDVLFGKDWAHTLHAMFVPDVPLVEIFLRGTCVYIALFLLLRLIKRQMGSIGATDLLVIVLIADAAQNAMAAEYTSVPDGIMLVATIIFWNALIEFLGEHFEWVERLVHPAPVPLVRHGRMNRRHMRRELISEDELMTQLRLQGVEHLAQVKQACLEGDGRISIITYDKKQRKTPDKQS